MAPHNKLDKFLSSGIMIVGIATILVIGKV